MKIAHISDLHICSKFKSNNLSIVKKIIKQIADSDADHLVITGDISDNSREEDFLWLRKTLKENDLLHSDKTSIIIGNHDIFGGIQTASEIIDFPLKCTRIDFKDKVRKFVDHFEELFQNIYSSSSSSVFPYVKVVDNVSIIGINSIDKYSRIRNPFASNGLYITVQYLLSETGVFLNFLIASTAPFPPCWTKSGDDKVSLINSSWPWVSGYSSCTFPTSHWLMTRST